MSLPEPIAIVGMGCRFPGDANSPEAFWANLYHGVDSVREVPPDRWALSRYYDPKPGAPGRSISKHGGFITGLDLFDAEFFGISPREAEAMDPQQRLLLETAWEAIEDAGIVLPTDAPAPIGVFIGLSTHDYSDMQDVRRDLPGVDIYTATGTAQSIAANRISYALNLDGPSVAVDTACSSSLVALHLACSSLLNRECDMALAGGANALIRATTFISFSRMGMLAPDGRCKAFDARANGFVQGEGAGVVALKRLADARAAGNPVYAVVLATALNQDAHTPGITVPSLEAQASLIRETCARAGVDPGRISYVEAHGTGTAVGDPIEAEALGRALRKGRPVDAPLIVGSVKTNIGHLIAGAGVAGLIKLALVLKHGRIPPHLHFREPNPNIDLKKLKIRIPTALEPSPFQGAEFLAGLNSFGFGGANAHALLQAVVDTSASWSRRPRNRGRTIPFVLSAHSEQALRDSARRYVGFFRSRRNAPDFRSSAYTAAVHRRHHRHRLCVVGQAAPEIADQLNAFIVGERRPGMSVSETSRLQSQRPVFVFSGQGPQWWNMGAELIREQPVFRAKIEACDHHLRTMAAWSLLEELARDEQHSRIQETAIAQPAIFALQVALAALLESWGLSPAAVVGHSVGEVAAAHVAGVLDLPEAIRVIYHRGRCMELAIRDDGRMLAAGIPWPEAEAYAARFDGRIAAGAENSPQSVTLSGDADALAIVAAELEKRGTFCRFLKVHYAFHCAHVDPVRDELLGALGAVSTHAPTVPLFSTVSGAPAEAGDYDAEYWWRNVRQPVRFAPVLRRLIGSGHDLFVELSPHPVLARPIIETLAALETPGHVLPTLRRQEPEAATLLGMLGALHGAGLQVDWRRIFPAGCHCVRLPAYSWQHEHHWTESVESRETRATPIDHPLLPYAMKAADPTWHNRLHSKLLPYLRDHVVQGHTVFPAAAYLEAALAAAHATLGGPPLVVEDVDLWRTLVIPERGDGPLMQLRLTPSDGHFTVDSLAHETDDTWTRHATGQVSVPDYRITPPRIDLAAVRARLQDTLDRDGMYEDFGHIGLEFGPAFRCLDAVRIGKSEALGRVTLPAALLNASYLVHPCELDGCVQLLCAALRSEEDWTELFLPVHADRVRFFERPSATVWCHARLGRRDRRGFEGSISMCNDDGRVLIDAQGLRCQALPCPATEPGEETVRNWFFAPQWREQALEGRVTCAPAPWQRPRAALKQVGRHEPDRYRLVRDSLDRYTANADEVAGLCALYVNRAFADLGWTIRKGQRIAADRLAQALGVAPARQQALDACLQCLRHAGIVSGTGNQGTIRRQPGPGDADAQWRAVLKRMPMFQAELALLRLVGMRLAALLDGRRNPDRLLAANMETLEHFFQDAPWSYQVNTLLGATVRELVARATSARTFRVLQLGAGTGGATWHVLPQLPPDRTDYVFSDRSSRLFARVQKKFVDCPFIRYRTLDIRDDPSGQGFAPGTFDLVIAAHALSAVHDLDSALRHVRTLLTPKGILLLTAPETLPVWAELVFPFILDSRGRDRTRRNRISSVPAAGEWRRILRANGFRDLQCLRGARHADEPGSVLYIAQTTRRTPPAKRRVSERGRGTWLLLADRTGVSAGLRTRLEDAGASIVMARSSRDYEQLDETTFSLRPGVAADIQQVLQQLRQNGRLPLRGIVQAWGLEAFEPDRAARRRLHEAARLGCHTTLQLVQALTAAPENGQKPRVFLVTQHACAPERTETLRLTQAALWGMGRVVVNERLPISCRTIDLSLKPGRRELNALVDELLAEDSEDQVALRGDCRYVPRIEPCAPPPHPSRRRQTGFRIDNPTPGTLDGLAAQPFRPPRPRKGEVTIAVAAAALNFRDVMKALGIYPVISDLDLLMGDECAGRVTAVGAGVRHLRPGDDVVAMGPGCFASAVTLPAAFVCRKPEGLTFEESVTVPTTFLTAYYALHHLGRISAGDRVLIHAATGGVGLAAIQIAQRAGADIFATAGTPRKRELLRALGVRHVMDSRSLAFAPRVMELTAGRGVDIVLNSLSGQAIQKGLAILAPHGRFLELGKRDVYRNAGVGLRALRENISLHVIDLAQLMADRPGPLRECLDDILATLDTGVYRPLPYRVFGAEQITDAFREMAQAHHVGKLVITMNADMTRVHGKPENLTAPAFRRDALYLIVGGTRGLGLTTAEWLASHGAGHLALVSRSGTIDADGKAALSRMAAHHGTTVRVEKTDITSTRQTRALFARLRNTELELRGIVHSAMVIDDALLTDQCKASFERVTAPKILGAWNLHEQSRDLPLDFFVMFSSVSSLFGNPGQSNYVAGNTFLDAMAHYRRTRGLPALTINWSRIAEVGYLARHPGVADLLEREGLLGLTPGQATEALACLIGSSATQVGVLRVDWARLSRSPYGSSSAIAGLLSRFAGQAGETGTDGRTAVLSVPPEQRPAVLTNELRNTVARILRTAPAKLDTERPLTELGLDSLMAVELIATLESQYEVSLPVGKIGGSLTVSSLVPALLDRINDRAKGGAADRRGEPRSGTETH